MIVALTEDIFILANGQNQIKLWNVKLNTTEQIQVMKVFLTLFSSMIVF